MKNRYKVKYNGNNELIVLNGYGIQEHIITLYYSDVTENLDGFILYDSEGNVFKDCSDYKYRYDILENDPKSILYTDLEGFVQTEKLNNNYSNIVNEEPLTNQELTECLADLMYEMSLTQLGITGGE